MSIHAGQRFLSCCLFHTHVVRQLKYILWSIRSNDLAVELRISLHFLPFHEMDSTFVLLIFCIPVYQKPAEPSLITTHLAHTPLPTILLLSFILNVILRKPDLSKSEVMRPQCWTFATFAWLSVAVFISIHLNHRVQLLFPHTFNSLVHYSQYCVIFLILYVTDFQPNHILIFSLLSVCNHKAITQFVKT